MVLRLGTRWRPAARNRALLVSVYLTALAGAIVVTAAAAGQLTSLALNASARLLATAAPAKPTAAPRGTTTISRSDGRVTLAQSRWDERMRTPWDRRARRGDDERGERAWASREDDDEDDDRDEDGDRPRYREPAGTYRTLCVRLCDGFYWPLSFSTTPSHFARDEQRCESSCGSPARLYKYANPGGAVEDMTDLDGKPYKDLKSAFLYRTQYSAACKCKPDPWTEAAKDQHHAYALEDAKRKGDKTAARELEALQARMNERPAMPQAGSASAAADERAEIPSSSSGSPKPDSSNVATRKAAARKPAVTRPADDDRERMSLGSKPASAPAPAEHHVARGWNGRADLSP